MFFHGYNFLSPNSTFCFIVSGLVPSPSPLFDSHGFNFCSTVSLLVSSSYSMVLAFVLASNGRLSVFIPTFLSSHLYKYWHKRGGLVEVSLHSNFFCALFFCLIVFFPYVCFCLGCWICYCWVTSLEHYFFRVCSFWFSSYIESIY